MRRITAATCFSGIGAPEVAMPDWDWKWCAETERFPAKVLRHHQPDTPNLGDVTAPDFLERVGRRRSVDVLVAGPPCQSFSNAGNRRGIGDPRGNLLLQWAEIIHATKPLFSVTENVPGLLTSRDNAFGHFLGGLFGSGEPVERPARGWTNSGLAIGGQVNVAWRVLDAKYFGVPQRRRRVFIVAEHTGASCGGCGEVLFECQSLSGDTSQGKGKDEKHPATDQGGTGSVSYAVTAKWAKGTGGASGSEHHNLLYEFNPCDARIREQVDTAPTALSRWGTGGNQSPLVLSTVATITGNRMDRGDLSDLSKLIPDASGLRARRIMPLECGRLQGFPDGYLDIPGYSDTAAYKALGNAMAVPVMAWILRRIEAYINQ